MKSWTEVRNNDKYMKSHSKLTYQLSFLNVSRKVDYHAGGKLFKGQVVACCLMPPIINVDSFSMPNIL